jgi:hypothetical protein
MELDRCKRPRHLGRRFAVFGALLGCVAACDSGNPEYPTPQPPLAGLSAVATGTGTLTVAVIDPEGRPLADASVAVFNERRSQMVGRASTSSMGVAVVESVPSTASVSVLHAFGEFYRNDSVAVAQAGTTFLSVTLQPRRPNPTAALLPVSISPGSINADRSALTVEITVVASASAPLAASSYGQPFTTASPALALALGDGDLQSSWLCFVWLDQQRTVPSCGAPWGSSPYTAAAEQFAYDANGRIPTLAAPTPAHSAMLLVDQSRRVGELDPTGRRSFALRRFVERAFVSSRPESLALVGFARNSVSQGTALLPGQPLWSPLGADAVFSSDRVVLDSGVSTLEPLIGGSAPVLDALESALALTIEHAPGGNRAIVAVLGGNDEDELGEAASRAALAELRRARDASAIQTVVIVGAPHAATEDRRAIAKLAAALRAPSVSLGLSDYRTDSTQWVTGSYGALDLAFDLLDGRRLPTLSATFRVAGAPGIFAEGTILEGAVFLEGDICPMGCAMFPLEFAVEIP